MAYVLGIDLGTTYTAAAVHGDGRTEIVTLGNRAASIPSVVVLKDDETILAGDAADRRAVAEPDRVARHFKRRVGDPTPLLLGGAPYSAEALMAKLLRWTVEQVGEREGGPPAAIAVTHPANWGPYKKDLLEQAVRLADLDGAATLSEPEAAAIHYASNERVEPGSVVAVYDLGGGTFDAAVLRKSADGWMVLGAPEGIERLGGIDIDEAVFDYVRRALPDTFDGLDADDQAVRAAVARLRQDCIEAKEALSSDTDASIPVMLPNVQTEVRLTRAEFEAMIRPTLQDTIGALQRALQSAEVEPDEVSAVLLVGGSSRIPLIAQLVGAEFGRPIAVDAHPKHAIALGAALAAADARSGDGLAAAGAVAADGGREVEQPADATLVTPMPGSGPPGDEAATTAALELTTATAPPAGSASEEPSGQVGVPDSPGTPAGIAAGGDRRTSSGSPADSTSRQDTTTAPADDGADRKLPLAALLVAAAVVVAAGVAAVVLLGGGDPEETVAIEGEDVADDPGPVEDPAAEVNEEEVIEEVDEEEIDEEPSVAADPEPTRREPYAELTDIRVEDGRYVVTYDAVGFTPIIDDAGAFHVHFFWDTLPVINAGTSGPDPGRWLLWDTPFEVGHEFFDVANRPQGARRICVIIAANDHAVADVTGDGEPDTDTGGCIDIPDG